MSKEMEIIERLAGALKKLTTSASAHIGADCMLQAQHAQLILEEEGVAARLVVGEAAWRIGPGGGDVITHSPRIGGYLPAGTKGFAYHAWLEMGSSILDFTTHTLGTKAAALDAIDGGKTSVVWCPPYLVIDKCATLTLEDVVQSLNEGVACYQEIPNLHQAMIAQGMRQELDPNDSMIMRMIFDHPEMVVVGPNDR